MHFHGSDMKSLQKFLDPSVLPANYKGTLPAIDYGGVEWFPALEQQAQYVEEWSQLGPAQWWLAPFQYHTDIRILHWH